MTADEISVLLYVGPVHVANNTANAGEFYEESCREMSISESSSLCYFTHPCNFSCANSQFHHTLNTTHTSGHNQRYRECVLS